jgi:hypothetical protein
MQARAAIKDLKSLGSVLNRSRIPDVIAAAGPGCPVLDSLRLIKYRHTKESIKLPHPIKRRFSHLQTTVFSIGLTRITITGNVRNINQSETRKDFLISLNLIIETLSLITKLSEPLTYP